MYRPRLAKSSASKRQESVFFLAPESVFCQPGTLLSFFQLLLCLSELGQVEGSDLLGLLDLLLVGLDLLLQLAGQLSHPILVLLVFVNLERELLDLALGLLVALLVLSSPSLHVSKFDLKLTDATLQLGHGSATSTVGSVGGFSELRLQLAQLNLHRVLCL